MAAKTQLFPKAGYWFLALLAAALVAFWPVYFSLLPYGPEAYAHLHSVGVVGWMLLLISQPFLIVGGKWQWHRTIGKASYPLVPYIVVTATLLAHSRFVRMDEAAFAKDGHSLYLPAAAIVLFVVCYTLAIVHRKKAHLHSRYMIATALPLFDPIIARLLAFYTSVPPGPILYPLIGYGLTDLVLLVLIWGDRHQKRGREAFLKLLPIFLGVHLGWFTLAQTGPWFRFASWFRDLPLT